MVVLSIDSPASDEVLEQLATAIEARFLKQVHMTQAAAD
jgi:hypothetical protein